MNQGFPVLLSICLGGALPVFAEENLAILWDGPDVCTNLTLTTITATDMALFPFRSPC
jgi:hypothetical protein